MATQWLWLVALLAVPLLIGFLLRGRRGLAIALLLPLLLWLLVLFMVLPQTQPARGAYDKTGELFVVITGVIALGVTLLSLLAYALGRRLRRGEPAPPPSRIAPAPAAPRFTAWRQALVLGVTAAMAMGGLAFWRSGQPPAPIPLAAPPTPPPVVGR
jgi:hypothetical protein